MLKFTELLNYIQHRQPNWCHRMVILNINAKALAMEPSSAILRLQNHRNLKTKLTLTLAVSLNVM